MASTSNNDAIVREINEKVINKSFPLRISVMTLNLWGNNHWPSRSDSLSHLMLCQKPDILLVQEASPEVLEFIEKLLINHDWIKHEKFEGWETECNIFWDRNLFSKLEHGCELFSLKEYPKRGLYWARLALKCSETTKLFIGNVHFPWAGSEEELTSGINQRIPCSYKVCEYLRFLATDETIVLGGDFNDDFHPIRILNEEMGLIDVFELLDMPPPITHPVRPSDPREEMRPNRTIDYLMFSLPSYGRAIAAFAKTIRGGKFPPPSDHYPVVSVFELCPPCL